MTHREILTSAQVKFLPLLKACAPRFGMVGGTAIALQIGHRRSIDFDLFAVESFDAIRIRRMIRRYGAIERVLIDQAGEYTIIVKGVKLTFFHYPFKISFEKKFERVIPMADVLTIAAMKAYALGRRAKWKDYVDLYFVMRDYQTLAEIVVKAKHIFGGEFNEKLFRATLAYFNDVDMTERIIYMPGYEVKDETIKKELTKLSVQ
ncbi:MAG: nucleotidyl transferase AbiEii/AbiGii toxin family protein [bacterium]|nr:nucleotidyl transferase AbiEii/AbiGii toxin family protein [bacterium]